LRHLIQDISTTCAKLGLPTDAQNWTQEHGSRWISEMCQQFNLTSPRQTYISGRVLLSMSQKDFVALAPEGGDTLYAQLQLWKTEYISAFESYHQQQNGGQSNGGITAADNSVPKNNWFSKRSMVSNSSMPNGAQTPSADDPRPSPFPRHSGTVHLWHFIRELLDHPNKQYGSCVRWVDRDEGTFKIESSHHLARFWGQRKNRAQMNYDKLSRSLRQYYKKGIIQKPEKKQRLVYKFLPPYNL
uniref:ETS domain-containing protein n=1 Tax=Angiostrongylus cantonensis TaxID=6313 RepID=A0A0K0D0G8_ANGCA